MELTARAKSIIKLTGTRGESCDLTIPKGVDIIEAINRFLPLTGIDIKITVNTNEWISVKDDLPNERCIAYMPSDDKSLEYRFIPAGLFKQAASEATHWQPLPEPPN